MRPATRLLCALAATTLLSASPVLAVAVTEPAAVGMRPPRGACTNPEPARPAVRQMPWAQQLLGPQRVWPFSTGRGITVAVIDSGVDADHPQLRRAGKVLDGRDFFLVGTLPGDYDCVSHGTAVAGIIAADRQPGIGFSGIAPGVRILPVRISDREVTDDGNTRVIDPVVLARGIRYAADQGADVINLSLSGIRDHRQVSAAIRYAQSKDALVVASVGNSQRDARPDLPSYPAAYPGVVGVGAIDIAGARVNSSQIGRYVDLVAPGDGVLGSTRVSGHAYFSGTSFAAPFVSATAALVRSAWPDLNAEQVVQRLLATATPARGGPGSLAYGAGVVDPYRAVTEGLGGVARPMPEAVRPAPDPAVEAEAAWWHDADRRARTLGIIALGAAAALTVLGTAAVRGRRRRWRPSRAIVTRSGPVVEPPPDRLFQPRRTTQEPEQQITIPPDLLK